MSIVAAGCPAVYCPLQDRAVSPAGTELRQSMEQAIQAPPDRVTSFLTAVGNALRKGQESEGVLLSVDTYTRMAEFVSMLPSDIPLPEIVVESGDQIGLDWHRGARRVLALTINETSFIGYSALLGHEPIYGRAPFAGTVPETVAHLLRRVLENDSAPSSAA